MKANRIVEYSVLLGYAVAVNDDSRIYVLYALKLDNTALQLLNTLERYPVVFTTDSTRAKELCTAPQWETVISEIHG